jgi:rhomboid protease GluP
LTTRIFGGWTVALAIGQHEYWRYLSFGLAHFGIFHIGFNSYALMQVGPLVEGEIGKARMLVVITVTQLCAAFASQFWYYNLGGNINVLTVGASGWLFGLIGYGIALFWVSHGMARVYRNVLLQWAVYAFIFGILIGANNAAHGGGLVGGLILGFLPLGDTQRTRAIGHVWTAAAWVSVVLWCITAWFLATTIIVNWSPGGVPR